MLDQQNGEASCGVEFAQEGNHHVDFRRTQTRHHLVEQQQFGPGRERARHFETLAVGQGQVLGKLVAAVVQAEPLQDRLGRGTRFGKPRLAMQRTDRDVLEHAQSLERLHDLEGAAHARVAHAVGTQAGDRLAVERYRAGGRRVDAGDHVEDRGLARAVGADQRVDRAGGNGETHVMHGAQATEALADTRELEARAAHLRGSPKPRRVAIHGQMPAGRYITMIISASP